MGNDDASPHPSPGSDREATAARPCHQARGHERLTIAAGPPPMRSASPRRGSEKAGAGGVVEAAGVSSVREGEEQKLGLGLG